MKYLKKFNESIDYKDVLEICKECLVEHLDKGFKVEIENENLSDTEPYICLSKNFLGDMWFKWDDVKDDIVKLIIIISEKWVISKIVIGQDGGYQTIVTGAQEVLDGIKVHADSYFVTIFLE